MNPTKRDLLVLEDPSIHIQHQVLTEDLQQRSHALAEILLISSGSATYHREGLSSAIKPGICLVIHPGEAHTFLNPQELHLTSLLFSPEILQSLGNDDEDLPGLHALFHPTAPRAKGVRSFQLTPFEAQGIQASLRRLETEMVAQQPGYARVVQAIFWEVALSLARFYQHLWPVQAREYPRIAPAIRLIEEQFANPLHLEDLATVSHLSVRHFQRVFHAALGMSPLAYLLKVRLTKAQQMLEQDNRRITDIALDCGFTDSNYFSRLLKQKTGLRPKQLRHS